jgi:hypothetical protein
VTHFDQYLSEKVVSLTRPLREEVFAEQSLKESKYLLKKNAIKNSENLLGKKTRRSLDKHYESRLY